VNYGHRGESCRYTISEATGNTFAKVLRAFLRQEPDIIMVGEIRDLETAQMLSRRR